jgi:hypothetical protein
MEPVLAVKAALVALAGTLTEAGKVRTLAIPPERVTTTPPAGAAAIKVTVQVVLPLEAKVEAAHPREESGVVADDPVVNVIQVPEI